MALTLRDFAGWETLEVSSGGHTTSGTVAISLASTPAPTYGGSAGAFRTNPTTTGTGYIELGAWNANGTYNNNSSQNMVGLAFKFRYATKASSSYERICSGHTNGGATKWSIVLNSTGTLSAIDNAGTTLGTSTATLSADTWYDIRVEAESGASGAELRVWIDGSLEITSSAGVTSSTTHGYVRLGKTSNVNSNSVDYYYDDAVLYMGANDGEAGEVAAGAAMKVRCAGANGNGTYTAWTGSYTDVDERPPTTAELCTIQNNTAGAETFTLENCSTIGLGASDVIDAVRAICQGSEASTVTSNASWVRVRTNSADTDTTGVNATTSYVYYNQLLTQDPNRSAAWTQSGFDEIEVGPVNPSGGTGTTNIRLAWAGAEVLYTPATGHTITPGGGLTFGGTVVPLTGHILAAAGGLGFSGAAAPLTNHILASSGGFALAGTVLPLTVHVLSVSGGLSLSGNVAWITHDGQHTITPGGGLTFAGQASMSIAGPNAGGGPLLRLLFHTKGPGGLR